MCSDNVCLHESPTITAFGAGARKTNFNRFPDINTLQLNINNYIQYKVEVNRRLFAKLPTN